MRRLSPRGCTDRRASRISPPRRKRHAFTIDLFPLSNPVRFSLPAKVRAEGSRIYSFQVRTRFGNAHRTLAITSVRSSASGAFCVNQSTSRRIRSASSVACNSWCCSINLRSFSVPKNCPSRIGTLGDAVRMKNQDFSRLQNTVPFVVIHFLKDSQGKSGQLYFFAVSVFIE